MPKTVKFNIDLIQNYVDDEDMDFAVLNLEFLSDGNNSHGIPITKEILDEFAYTIIGKPIVAKYNQYANDVEGHEHDEIPVGVIPANAEIYFKETKNGRFACVDGVIFKLYANKVYELYKEHNHRAVSVEMTVEYQDNDERLPVKSINIRGVTLLGLSYEPSCTLASSTITRFEKEASNFYENKYKTFSLQDYAERRKSQLLEQQTYKVDKSKESVSNTAWGDVDKTTMQHEIMEASNRDSLVQSVYLKVENGWENAPSEHLKYPVMQLKENIFVYNKDGISSALGRAEINDPDIAKKAINLQKKLGLYKESEGEKEEMAKEVKDKKEQLEAENLAAETKEDKKEEKLEELAADNKAKEETPKEDKEKKPENKDEEKKDEKLSSDANLESAAYSDMMEKESERNKTLVAELAGKDNIIMEQNTELEALRKFKSDKDEEDKKAEMTKTLADIQEKGCNFTKEELEKLETEGMSCTMSNLDGWKNKVKALAFESVKVNNTEPKKDELWTMSFTKDVANISENSLWEVEDLK